MKKVGGTGVVRAWGGILWLITGLALAVPSQGSAACDCSDNGYAWLVNTKIRFNNDAMIVGNVGANLPGGLVRFGRNSCQGMNEANPCIGNSVSVSADTLRVGEGSSIAGSESNNLKLGTGATVRNPPLLNVTLPLVNADPTLVCGAFAPIVCGGAGIAVPQSGNVVIAPGVYGPLVVGNGASVIFASAGSYTFCSVKIGSNVSGTVHEDAILNVAGKFSMGSGSNLVVNLLGQDGPFVLNVAGPIAGISQGSLLEAEVRAPFGKIKMQRGSIIRGCSCSNSMTSDKGHANICQDSGSPSGAFLD
jgi:hypothetical protein